MKLKFFARKKALEIINNPESHDLLSTASSIQVFVIGEENIKELPLTVGEEELVEVDLEEMGHDQRYHDGFADGETKQRGKLGPQIDALKEKINYALLQKDLDYGMEESTAIKFRMRKVFAILKGALK